MLIDLKVKAKPQHHQMTMMKTMQMTVKVREKIKSLCLCLNDLCQPNFFSTNLSESRAFHGADCEPLGPFTVDI